MPRFVLDGAPPGEAALALLKIAPVDIEANRVGRLGRGQKRKRRLRALIGLLICTWVGVAFFAGAAMSHRNGGQWFVPFLFGALALALGFRFAVPRLRREDQPVRCLTGPVRLQLARNGAVFGGKFLLLVVDEERCYLPQSLRSTYKNWRAALTDETYRVYVVGDPPGTVVGVEPA